MRQNPNTADIIARLRAAFERLGERPFPEDSDDADASQLHAKLAEFDGYVAGRVTTLLNGGRLSVCELESDKRLEERLEQLAISGTSGAIDARKYLDYFSELEAILALGRSLAR